MRKKATLWDDQEYRSTLAEAIALAIGSFYEIDAWKYDTWTIGYSGGKDSTTMLTLLAYAFDFGVLERPKRIQVQYADTGMEIPPLQQAALSVLSHLKTMDFEIEVVRPELDHRFFVYLIGRGVVVPNNGRSRWCTRKLKVIPMDRVMRREQSKALLLTGVRQGESAMRDGRIAAACSKDGGECGQGYMHVHYQESNQADSHAPILAFRVCHVWDFLTFYAPRPTLAFDLFKEAGLSPKRPQQKEFKGFDTTTIAEIYGQDTKDGQEEPLDARTGCMGCPLVTNPQGVLKPDKTLERVVSIPKYAYLTPVKRLPEIYKSLLQPENRLRKIDEKKKDGTPTANPDRMGPSNIETRLSALEQVLAIQAEVNTNAGDMPQISLISPEEEARIRELIAIRQFPYRWTGEEEAGNLLIERERQQKQDEWERILAGKVEHTIWKTA